MSLSSPVLGEVPLDPEGAEQGRGAAKVEAQRAARGVRDRRGDVGTHELGSEELHGPALDLLAGQGVGHVRGPEALHPLGHAEVDTAAARGAALDLDVRVPAAQVVEQPVHGLGLQMHTGPTPVPRLREVAVVVPLEIADGPVLGQQRVQSVQDVCVGVGVGQVEHLLMAPEQRQPA